MRISAQFILALPVSWICLFGLSRPQPATPWNMIPLAKLCVTEGAIHEDAEQRLTVDDPKMRAFATVATSQDIEADFTYFGKSKTETPLGSGIMRRQFGLKLRAQDPCNLVYAMWRFEPKTEIVVSVKSNLGQHTSAECGNRGYSNVKPTHASRAPAITAGSSHKLRAQMNGQSLRVYVDESLAWEGVVGETAASLRGPVGIRSDDVKLTFALRAGELGKANPDYQLACKPGSGESE